jgi:hypothetical protein
VGVDEGGTRLSGSEGGRGESHTEERGEDDEKNARRDWPMRGKGKNCLGKRREKVC